MLCCLDKQVRIQPQSVGVSRLTNLPDCHLCAECKIITVARNDKLWMAGVGSNTFNQSPLFTLQVLAMKLAFLLGENSFHSQLLEVRVPYTSSLNNLTLGFSPQATFRFLVDDINLIGFSDSHGSIKYHFFSSFIDETLSSLASPTPSLLPSEVSKLRQCVRSCAKDLILWGCSGDK